MIIQKRQLYFRQKAVHYLSALLIVFFTVSPLANAEEVTSPPPVETTTTEPVVQTSEPVIEPVPPINLEPAPPTSPEPVTPVTGPQEPTGVDASKYVYNEATGMWENDKYSWNPQTNQTSPITAQTYSYNPDTGHWDTTQWIYDAPSGTYVPNIISVIAPPDSATTVGSSEEMGPSIPAESGSTGTEASRTSPLSFAQPPTSTNSSINSSSESTGVFDMFYNAVISNNINSTALTGDALVAMNTLAGNALSGDASSIATVFNLLQSVWNLGLTGSLLNVFTQNLFGNIVGDLWLDPGEPSGSVSSNTSNDLTINATGNTAIENVINLEAVSGDATVTKNTTAGNATTGTATVIANIINAINSSIVSGGTFLGMLNIYGSLDGDILLPQELISSLLAANTLGTLNTSQISNTDILGNFTNNASTTNNIVASAGSGDAEVSQNTSAGNATSGDAETNVTVLNLTGRQVIGANALLVFVNVMGTWVGMIVDAPVGSTSAALGGGITSDNSLTLNGESNQSITNDVNVNAQSGDALVSQNTQAGNATSGDAYAAVNILNLNGSQFALTDWFGILFINVFGAWNGSFGIDTLAGELLPQATATGGMGAGSLPIGLSEQAGQIGPEQIKAFSFVPQSDGTYELESSDQGVAALASAQVLDSTAVVNPEAPQEEQMSLGPLQSLAHRDWS
ncbi:MAG: hypothetical protein ABIR46_04185, partial [Candidatus Saccharimonadales bacterium]